MILKTKKFIVISLEKACDLTRHKFCNKFAYASAILDTRWGTNVWKAEFKNDQPSTYEED